MKALAQRLFLGRPLYWALWAVILAVLGALGSRSFHVREFVTFQFVVLGLAVAAVVTVVAAYREGERITREPLDE